MILKELYNAFYPLRWYIVLTIGFIIFNRISYDFITDTYVYVVFLNISIILIPLLILWMLNKLSYYVPVTTISFFIVWSTYYYINYSICKDEKAFNTQQIEVYNYIPMWKKSSGIKCRYKGNFVNFVTEDESERLYAIYGDSVINHIHVRLSLKKALPHVYYIDDFFIEYDD